MTAEIQTIVLMEKIEKYKDSQMITNKLTIEVVKVWITVIEEENKLILSDKITVLELQNSKRKISFRSSY